ncbi:MAG: uroporphyrinogen decarboxylase family protein [Candidatus Zipacnadales bacterium]
MTRREIVSQAVEFTGPPRLPIHYCNRDFEHSDTIGTSWAPSRNFVPSETGMTEWGYVWHSLDRTMGQPHAHPLANWEALETYTPPDPYAPGRLDHLPHWWRENVDRYRVFSIGISGFNCATFLRGFEAFLMDLHLKRKRAERVLDLVFGVENALIDQLAPYDLEAVKFADDWGTQQGLMIHPDLWREVFKPRYADQFARIHRQKKHVWFHTCGDVRMIMADFIEIGVDILELLQPELFGIEWMAQQFGGQVCFCCSIDHQRYACQASRDEIFAYARRLNDNLGSYNGGFIAYIEDYGSLGMSEQNYQWIREAFHSLADEASSTERSKEGD